VDLATTNGVSVGIPTFVASTRMVLGPEEKKNEERKVRRETHG
jgi:hypothetical protein